MEDKELLRARWATLAALILVFGFSLYSIASWNLWVSGALAVLISALLTAVLEIWLRLSLRRAAAGQQAAETRQQLEQARLRTQVLLAFQNRLLLARSEKEILEAAMQVGSQVLGVNGASFVPYDEWGQSLPALTHGKVPGLALQSWAQRLSQPETRQVCKNCQVLHGGPGCILLASETKTPSHVQCFPLSSSGRQVGVFNYFYDHEAQPEPGAAQFLDDILAAAGQALENQHSRDQEIAALLYLQTVTSPKSDLTILLNSLLENVQQALDVDFALLYLPWGIPGQVKPAPQLFSRSKSAAGPPNPIPGLPFLEGIWKSVLASGQSLSLENVQLDKRETWKAVLAVPLIWRGDDPAGVLVLGSNTSQAFAQRHQALLETLAGQAALLIQNKRLMVQVEYQAVVDERTRLAREIHDGLAQTLAFLKIQSGQMQNYLARGETEKLNAMLQANSRTLSDAYIDARQAIDNLRRLPSTRLHAWLAQVAADYEQATSQKVSVSVAEFATEYPANIQAQLIRIVQEALSNIRKHAGAQAISIAGLQDGDTVLIEVRDDGRGFTPESVDGSSRYGLLGMRERAESIGADFQITSQVGAGTLVSLRMPAAVKEEI